MVVMCDVDLQHQHQPTDHLFAPRPSAFTCATCHLVFSTGEVQRTHYRTDWHRYNLRRKVAELAPVSESVFEERIGSAAARLASEVVVKEEEPRECQACRKNFASKNSYENHLKSKKHLEQQTAFKPKPSTPPKQSVHGEDEPAHLATLPIQNASAGDDAKTTIEEHSASAVQLAPEDCLFCPLHSADFDSNLDHMTHDHSFYIPDLDYLVDLGGLIAHLAERIAVYHCCLYCNEKGRAFHSIDAVRKHMLDKGHTQLMYDAQESGDLAPFYDYSSSYPDFANLRGHLDSELDPMESALLMTEESELILPSGARLGHREYRRYYDQKLKPAESRDCILINRLAGQYSELGLVSHISERERCDQRRDLDKRGYEQLGVGIRANKLQKHFRRQIL